MSVGRLTQAIREASRKPRARYRWHRLIQSCDLDPDRLPKPLTEPGNDDFIICGFPRSGTSLLAAALFQPPDCVVAMEPWDGLRLEPAALLESLRSEIDETGVMARGRLDVAALQRDARVAWVRDGEAPVELDMTSRYSLGVKWPCFWRYLELLPTTRFLVCVRDPVEVLASMERSGGMLARGLDYDVAFNRVMNSHLLTTADDPEVRRALHYEYIASRIAEHLAASNVMVVRYERWHEEPTALLDEVRHFLGLEALALDLRVRAPEPTSDRSGFAQLVASHIPSSPRLGYGPS